MAAPSGEDIEELNPSKLGTKKHWDEVYKTEYKNFKENGDVGEVWFGYDSVERVVEWMEESPLVAFDHSILDLGCGNGVMSIEMYKAGFKDITAIDYSRGAIDLAEAVAKDEGCGRDIRFMCVDFLDETSTCPALHTQYEICVDKGTYDAICLNPDDPKGQRARFMASMDRLVKDCGLLVLTSCNWTVEELREHFKEHFNFGEQLKTPSFHFGGKTGNRETCVIFIKKEKKKTTGPSIIA